MSTEKNDFRAFLFVLIGVILGLVVLFTIKAVILSVITGMILAYIFMPLYKFSLKRLKSKNLTASLMLLIALIILIIPVWFVSPLIISQVFEIFKFTQSADIESTFATIISTIFPTADGQFVTQMTVTIGSITSKAASITLNSLVELFLNIPTILLYMFIIFFVFFYTLRDSEILKTFVKEISPFNKSKEELLTKQFKEITYSIVYGQIIVGFVQGLLAGAGMLLFGIPNALVLSIVAIILGILPILGPALVWIPLTVYLFATGNTGVALGYLLYNIVIVSTVDHFLRVYLVSKMTQLSPVLVLVGMIGGLFLFGALGLLLGPLILAYILTFLALYKNRKLDSIFHNEAETQKAGV